MSSRVIDKSAFSSIVEEELSSPVGLLDGVDSTGVSDSEGDSSVLEAEGLSLADGEEVDSFVSHETSSKGKRNNQSFLITVPS